MLGLKGEINFYASFERVFNPSLRRRPVVMLSNNDGCAIAGSQEAERLGVGPGMVSPSVKCRIRCAGS